MAKNIIIIITVIMLSYIAGCTEKENSEPVVEPPQMAIEEIEPTPEPIAALPEPNEPAEIIEEPEPVEPEVNAAEVHNICADIFKNYVNGQGLVDYAALRRKRIEIRNVAREFASFDADKYKSLTKADKIAFWINAYNINKLAAVVENYPIESTAMNRMMWGAKSVRHILPKLNVYKFIVMDEEFSFSTVENNVLGKEFDDPKILLALSQATLGSPAIYSKPYYGENLDVVLDEYIKSFIAGAHGLKIDREADIVYLPAVLHPNFYGKRFVAKFATDKKFKDKSEDVRAVLNFVSGYISDSQKDYLERKNYTLKYNRYDWTLNDSSR